MEQIKTRFIQQENTRGRKEMYMQELHISVRNLVEFIFRAGDIDNRAGKLASAEAMMPFHDLKRSGKFNIMQSPDKKLRVYSYEDFGGTMKFYKSYIQYKRNGKIIVEQLGDSIYPFKGRYTSLYYQIEMGKNEYKLYGYWQISSNEIECDTIIINKMNYGK